MSLISDIHADLENGAVRLITEYRARLFADAVQLCGNSTDAEDLVSRTFLKVLGRIDQHRPDGDFYGWMKAILTNIHRDDQDRPVTRGTVAVDAATLERYAGADTSTDDQILANSDRDALREAISQLEPEYRQAVAMYYFNELSLREIAVFLNSSTSSVSRKLEVARKILAAKLETKLGKKPVALFLAALLGIGSLFGAWQAGLLDPIFSQRGAIAQAIGEALPESFPLQEETLQSGEAESFPLQEETASTQVQPQSETSSTQEESQSETTKEQTMNMKTVKALVATAVVAASAEVSNAGYVPTWRGLPDGYTQVTYIESSGSQYVDLGIPAKSGLAMGTVMSWVQAPGEVGYCSAIVGSRLQNLYYSNRWMLGYGSSWLNMSASAAVNKIYQIDSELRNGRQALHVEDENGNVDVDWTRTPALTGDINLNVNLALFGNVTSTGVSNKSKARCYELMFWSVDGEGARTLIGDFVPCLDANGVAGLYDLYGESFHAPSAALAYGAPVLQPDTLTVEAEAEQGDVTPAFGKVTDLADGQTVPFSAPSGEFRLDSGDYCSYDGYRIYVTRDGVETLEKESDALSGSYVHAAGTSARLVWRQIVRKGGRMFPTAWSSVVSVPGYDVAETLVNFPVLFRLAEDSPEGFSYAACRADGNDILFTDAGGNVIPHEIEKWDPEGESLIWVNLPKLAKGTTFRFCYGNASVEEPAPAANVWSDGFAGVWHLDETGTAATAIDATGRGNDGVATTKSTGGLDEMTAESDGAICGARRIGISKTNYYKTPSSTAFNLGQSFTVSAWIRGTGRGQSRIIGHKQTWNTASGWEILWSTATTASPRGSGGDTERARSLGNSATTWTHVVWVFNGAAVSTYSNGVKSGDDSVITPVVDTTRALEFGGTSVSQDYFGGSFDEVRIMGGAANALRIKADYDTVTSAEFLSAAPAKQSAGADVLTVISSGREIGTVTPDWGEHTGLADGQVIPFSAPAEEQVESEDVHFAFTGYSLYSTGTDGTERLIETRDATSGTYTHVGGTTARLVWRGNDLFRVSAETNHGTVVGCGYVRLGGQVTLRAVADEGYRFSEWVGDAVPDELRENPEITLTVNGVTPLVARFTVEPALAAFWDFKEGAAGSPVTATANAKGPESFSGSGAVVENASGAGLLPVYSAQTPGFKVYSDATCTELLADRPQSVRFGANDLAHGGGEVTIAGLGSWISRQDVCTVEFFCRGDVYRASRAAFSLDVGNDPNALYYPAGSAAAILFSCETDRAGHKGGVSPAGEYGFSPSYDAWHHVAVVYSRERQVAKLYLDRTYRTEEKSVAIVEQSDNGVPLRLGSAMANNAAANCFSGFISCLRVSVGELIPADFMCAAPSEPEGDTLAFYTLRGRKGDAVKTVSPVLGCSRLTGEARLVDGKDAPIVYSDDVPGAALYDGEAGLASGVPLARKISSVDIRNVEDGDPSACAASVLDFYDMSTELSVRDAFTIEFFAKFDGTGIWRTPTSFNVLGGPIGKTGSYLFMPYSSAGVIYFSGGASVSVNPTLHANRVWHHLALTYDKMTRQMKLYVDYSKSPASCGMTTAPTAASLVFGGDTSKMRAFRGKIAGVRISTRALEHSEFLIAAPRPDSGFILMLK